MSLKKICSILLPSLVLALSLEIVWRRLVIGQIPAQFSAIIVYALLALNVLYVGYEYSRLFKGKQR